MRRTLGCAGLGLLVLIVASMACSATHAFASPYQTLWYYPYLPWYWGGLYWHYPWNNDNYISYHGGYTRSGTLAPGYSYDPANNVVLSRAGQPVYPHTDALGDIKPSGSTPDPRTLSNAPASVKAASGSCSGQNSCTGGGNAVTTKSGGAGPPGSSGSGGNTSASTTGCSGQSSCTGGGNAVTGKSGGSGSAGDSTGGNTSKPSGNSSSGSSGAGNGGKPANSGSSGKSSGSSSGSSRSGGSSGGSRSGGSSRSGGGRH
ncbi:MAG TPA: hypothetical protein VFA70_11440 [Dehalococcoidia bacterium]|jgi:hypothetical protein|nr:hypothetical protein [Dehalococcoidia bacterium]